ncbi:MAG: hypothetical protein ACKPEN_02770, partial [Planktothrix sp.]
MAYITKRRRSVRRSSVRGYPFRHNVRIKPDSLVRLKYSRILFLMALFLTVIWTVGTIFKLIFPPAKPQSQTQNITVSASASQDDKTVVYNVKNPPNLTPSKDLQTLVDRAVEIAKIQGLPTESLSISLIDVSNPKTHRIAGYNNTILRFPASVAKLYWMVAFFGYAEKGYIPKESPFYTDLSQMMRISDNDSASRIVDAITQTE